MGVALLGMGDDAELKTLAERLGKRVDVHIWDLQDWPGETPLSICQRSGKTEVTIDNRVAVDSLDAVFVDKVGFSVLHDRFQDSLEERPYSLCNQLREYRGTMLSTLQILEDRGVRVVNSTYSRGSRMRKPGQLATLAAAGLPVPESLTTNDPDAVKRFQSEVDEVVYKPVAGRGYARLLDADESNDVKFERLANSPVLFQQRIDGDDLRVYVVDGEVVAAGRIVNEAETIDLRLENHTVESVTLRPEIERVAVKTAEELGLSFTGIDIIADDDEFTILEANSAPMFVNFDEMAGTDVAGALADLLAS